MKLLAARALTCAFQSAAHGFLKDVISACVMTGFVAATTALAVALRTPL